MMTAGPDAEKAGGRLFVVTATPALADFPTRAVQMIVPWGLGGGSDIRMRVVENHAGPYLGQSIPIITMPGVSGTLGLPEARERAGDGDTLAQIHEALLVACHTGMTDVRIRDFEPIASFTSSAQFLVVNAAAEWETFDDFVAHAQENPGALRVGVTLAGTPHLHDAMIEDAVGIAFSYVGHEGTGERVRAQVGGHIDAIMGDVSSAQEFVANGDLRYLVAGSVEQHPAAPDTPTLTELGFDVELSNNRGLWAPAATPDEMLEALAAAFANLAEKTRSSPPSRPPAPTSSIAAAEDTGTYMARLDGAVGRLASKLVR